MDDLLMWILTLVACKVQSIKTTKHYPRVFDAGWINLNLTPYTVEEPYGPGEQVKALGLLLDEARAAVVDQLLDNLRALGVSVPS